MRSRCSRLPRNMQFRYAHVKKSFVRKISEIIRVDSLTGNRKSDHTRTGTLSIFPGSRQVDLRRLGHVGCKVIQVEPYLPSWYRTDEKLHIEGFNEIFESCMYYSCILFSFDTKATILDKGLLAFAILHWVSPLYHRLLCAYELLSILHSLSQVTKMCSCGRVLTREASRCANLISDIHKKGDSSGCGIKPPDSVAVCSDSLLNLQRLHRREQGSRTMNAIAFARLSNTARSSPGYRGHSTISLETSTQRTFRHDWIVRDQTPNRLSPGWLKPKVSLSPNPQQAALETGILKYSTGSLQSNCV